LSAGRSKFASVAAQPTTALRSEFSHDLIQHMGL
jgi:hypothetical protein